MNYIKRIVIVRTITESYAFRLGGNLESELRRRLEEGTMSVINSDSFSTVYQNLNPSLVESVKDNDFVYIIDPQDHVENCYQIVPS